MRKSVERVRFNQFELPENIKTDATVRLMDLTGRTIQSWQTTGVAERLELNNVVSGNYILEILIGDNAYMEQISVK